MKANYQYALTELLKDEGGYTNDPQDPGGPTNFGITLADYRKYINPKGTATDVQNMTVDQAKSIYKPKYWDAVNGDSLPSGVDYCVFDYGVNSGVSRANRIYAKYSTLDATGAINAICDERLAFLKSLSTWGRFGKGWSNRVANVRNKSIKLAHAGIPANGPAIIVATTAAAAGASSYLHWPKIVPYVFAGLFVVGLGIFIYERIKHRAVS